MSDRFYAPTSFEHQTVRLTGSEAHHLRDVLRLRVGGEVVLFDGDGTEAAAEIVGVEKSTVELRILATRRDQPTGASRIIVGTAVPKGERFRWLVEKTAELGIEFLVPLYTARSVVDPRETRLEKMRALVIAACKQSRRNRLMQIEPTTAWTDFLARYTGKLSERIDMTGSSRCMLVADPTGERLSTVFERIAGQTHLEDRPSNQPREISDRTVPGREIVLAIGPEGGFTPLELEQAINSGAHLVSLGPRILRVETAAIALASYFALQ